MKHLFILMTAALLLYSCGGGASGDDEAGASDAIDSARLVTVKYSVEGMTCTGCENTINYAVGELSGVTKVHSSFKEKFAEVTFDSTLVTADQIGKTIGDKGYTFIGVFQDEAEQGDNP